MSRSHFSARMIALFLVPCLIGEPAMASLAPVSPQRAGEDSVSLLQFSFVSEALALKNIFLTGELAPKENRVELFTVVSRPSISKSAKKRIDVGLPMQPYAYYLSALGISTRKLILKPKFQKGWARIAMTVDAVHLEAFQSAFLSKEIRAGDPFDLYFYEAIPAFLRSGPLISGPGSFPTGRRAVAFGNRRSWVSPPSTDDIVVWFSAYTTFYHPALGNQGIVQLTPVYGLNPDINSMESSYAIMEDFPKVKGMYGLDAFCGTGLFDFIALQAGAAKMVAYDKNPFAYWNVMLNARRLGVTDRLDVYLASDLDDLPKDLGPFDFAVASPPSMGNRDHMSVTHIQQGHARRIPLSELPTYNQLNLSDSDGLATRHFLSKVRRHLRSSPDKSYVYLANSLDHADWLRAVAPQNGLLLSDIRGDAEYNADHYVQYIFEPLPVMNMLQAPADRYNLHGRINRDRLGTAENPAPISGSSPSLTMDRLIGKGVLALTYSLGLPDHIAVFVMGIIETLIYGTLIVREGSYWLHPLLLDQGFHVPVWVLQAALSVISWSLFRFRHSGYGYYWQRYSWVSDALLGGSPYGSHLQQQPLSDKDRADLGWAGLQFRLVYLLFEIAGFGIEWIPVFVESIVHIGRNFLTKNALAMPANKPGQQSNPSTADASSSETTEQRRVTAIVKNWVMTYADGHGMVQLDQKSAGGQREIVRSDRLIDYLATPGVLFASTERLDEQKREELIYHGVLRGVAESGLKADAQAQYEMMLWSPFLSHASVGSTPKHDRLLHLVKRRRKYLSEHVDDADYEYPILLVWEELKALRFSDEQISQLPIVLRKLVPMAADVKAFEGVGATEDQLSLLRASMRNLITEKETSGNRTIVVYGIGLGQEPQEAMQFVQAVNEEVAAAARSRRVKDPKKWSILFLGIEAKSDIVSSANTVFSNINDRRYEGTPLKDIRVGQVIMKAIRGDALDLNELEYIEQEVIPLALGVQTAKKADFLLHRHLLYVTDKVQEKTHSLNAPLIPTIDLHELGLFLDSFLQTRNVLSTFAQPGTIYVVEPTFDIVDGRTTLQHVKDRSEVVANQVLLLPGSRLETASELKPEWHVKPGSLADRGTGILQIVDMAKVTHMGLQEFQDSIRHSAKSRLGTLAAPVPSGGITGVALQQVIQLANELRDVSADILPSSVVNLVAAILSGHLDMQSIRTALKISRSAVEVTIRRAAKDLDYEKSRRERDATGMPFRERPLRDLLLPRKILNALTNSQWPMNTIGDLLLRSKAELLRIKNLKGGSVQLIENHLWERGREILREQSA